MNAHLSNASRPRKNAFYLIPPPSYFHILIDIRNHLKIKILIKEICGDMIFLTVERTGGNKKILQTVGCQKKIELGELRNERLILMYTVRITTYIKI